MSVYCLVTDGEITRYNITLPFATPAFSVNANTKNVEELGLYPVTGQEPSYDPVRERLAGPTYAVVGQTIERTWTVEQVPDEEKAGHVRAQRNELIAKCDWTQLDDTPITNSKKLEWAAYRQALRDIPDQPGFPWDITWPTQP